MILDESPHSEMGWEGVDASLVYDGAPPKLKVAKGPPLGGWGGGLPYGEGAAQRGGAGW